MLEQITFLVIVLFFIGMVCYTLFQKREKKIDLLQIIMDKHGDLSFMRFASFVCLWLFVWMVKRSIGMEATEVNIELILIVGALTFFPKLFQKFIEKYSEKKLS